MNTILINHTNKETSKEFSIQLNKPFVIIYGKNGSGKTTISRNEKFDKNYVFNTDYIHRNVYIESSTGTKDDVSTKESFSSLWLGEEIVEVKTKLDRSKIKNKKLLDIGQKINNEIISCFNEYKLKPDFAKINNLCKEKSINIDIEQDFDIEQFISSFKSEIVLNDNILNKEMFETKLSILKNNNVLSMLIADIKKDNLLIEIYLNENNIVKQNLMNYINDYNNGLNSLIELENAFKSKNKKLQSDWIKNALQLHENIDFCLFCGNENIEDIKDHWGNILNNTIKDKKEKFLKEIECHIVNLINIQNHKENYSEIVPDIVDSILKLKTNFELIKKQINENKEISFNLDFYDGDKSLLILEVNKVEEECHDYLFKNFLSRYEMIYHLKNKYSEKINMLDVELVNKMNENALKISTNINDILTKLGLVKELEVKLENRGNERKYNFSFKNKKTSIKTLSDGQKHKLALAIFLAGIRNQGVEDKIIVLDDPVVTLDQRTYYAVRSEIISLTSLKPKMIVLMTHNIGYLQIQLSNLFNKDLLDNVTFYHLLSDSIKEIDPNILNYDDLTLYKKALLQVSTFEEFSILATINIRMYRYFLDHYMRITGVPSTDNPKNEIEKLNIDNSKKEKLNEINVFIEGKCKDLKCTNNKLVLTFEKLNDLISILGYPKLIDDKEMAKIKEFDNNFVRDLKYSGDNIIFQILFWVSCAMLYKDNNYKDIKNYVSHPRHQMTSSIVGVDFYNSEIDDFIKN